MSDTPALSDEARSEIETLLAGKRKIEAIKEYREHCNVGLKEAKEAVEDLERQLSSGSAEKANPLRPSGCAVVLLFLGLAGFLSVALSLGT